MKTYRCIMIDPPWRLQGGGSWKNKGPRYETIHLSDMPNIIMNATDENGFMYWKPDPTSCHLWMWATAGRLPDALWLMDVLGFRYKTNACWVKKCKGDRDTRFLGLGRYLRTQHELLLFGTRGDAMMPMPGGYELGSVIEGKVIRHSQKPSSQYQLIERVSKGPFLEMFARNEQPGWDVWGDEI